LGNPAEYTIKELAEKVMEEVGAEHRVEYRELPSDDPKRRQPDITRAKTLLGWEPSIGLKEGLQRTVQDFKDRTQANPGSLYCVHQKEARETRSTIGMGGT